MKVKDTSFDLEKFIALVKARSAIYAVNNRDHHNRLIVDSLWTEVAQEMQKPVIECKTKWHQLRNNFARELRREKNLSKRSIWYLRRPLNFLTENILQSRSKKYVESTATSEPRYHKQSSPKMEMEEMTEETFEDTVAYDEYSNHQESSREVETYEPVEEQEVSGDSHEIPAKLDERDEVSRLNDERSADLSFFQSLFPDIQKLSARRKRKFKETILVSLYRLVDEEEEEASAGNYRISYSSNRHE